MPAYIWDIILKTKANRSLAELLILMEWWSSKTPSELKYPLQVKQKLDHVQI